MSQTAAQRIEELQDQVYALQQLLLSHILAFDDVSRDATEVAFSIARSQSDEALRLGRNRVAIRIDAMVEEIQQARD